MFILPNEVLVIMGPTASGKSALALEWAEKFNGEIVSVDSMQLYRGLEIGTAQPTAEEKARIPHHLVGCFDFQQRVDLFEFIKLADAAIADIVSRGKTPILAGGTGLYLRGLLCGVDDLPADRELRTQLDEQYDSDEAMPALLERMAQLDPAAYERWKQCRRRLIRALEVKLLTGKSITELQQNSGDTLRYNAKGCKIELDSGVLKDRIRRRTIQMLKDGWIGEAETAIANGLFQSPTAHQVLGYKLIAQHLAGEFDHDTLIDRIATATWQLARRQRTWFRHQLPFFPAKKQ